MSFVDNLKHDFPSSIVVFFVALPLCLGIALASGAPLFSGLIAGMVGGIVVGSLSGSSLGVSGPAAGLAVIVLNAIQDLGSYETFLLAIVIGGVFQLILGIAKAGIIGYFFPSSVIKGMLTGIGSIIVLKQIPHSIGYDSDYEGDLGFFQADGENTFTELINMLDYFEPSAIFVSLSSLLLLMLWERVLSKKNKIFTIIQGPIVVVIFGILFQLITLEVAPEWAFSQEHLVNVPEINNFGSFLSQFSLPNFNELGNSEVYIVAITIAVVASLETLLSVEATDKLDPKKGVTPTNRELMAQGTGNIISGMIGGLPITQVIVRSSANIQSNGKTKMSTIIHGFLILFSVLFISNILNYIPLSALASILIIVGFKLAKPSLFKSMYKLGKKQFIPFVITIVGIVFTDLLIGITLGLVIGIFIILLNNYRNSHFMHIKEVDDDIHRVTMTLSEEVTFLNKAAILKELNDLPNDTEVTIDMTQSVRIDYDVCEIIANFMKFNAIDRNIKVIVKNTREFNTADY